ncbi:MAG: hypothetical protein RL748_3484 [Pseudomonadota bacterium]|jgi:uncharacterized DUF497 family protein
MADWSYDFDWDSAKAGSNIKKHRVSFEQAATVFQDALALTVYDDQHSQYEERWFTIGHSLDGALLAVSHTFVTTSPINVRIRIISARAATKQERRFYADEPR